MKKYKIFGMVALLVFCGVEVVYASPRTVGSFVAPRGPQGANGTNGTNGTNGADGCPPLISQTTKANGCYQITSQAQKRVGNNCTLDTSVSVETLDEVCDCRPTETRTRCYGTGADACADNTRSGVKITTTQCDGSQPTVSYIYDNNCGITVDSVTDVHQDNDSTKPVTHKRVNFANTCGGTIPPAADIPVGEGGAPGEPGGDYNPCDGLEAGSQDALSRVHHTTGVYISHGASNTTTTTTGIGYYQETNVMCDTTGNKIVKKYDKCEPVSLATGTARTVGTLTCGANQAILTCTPQEAPTTPYNVCSDGEASGYPKVEYIAPTVSNGKFTEKGYTNLVHKYVGTDTEMIVFDKLDTCHSVFRQEHSRNASTNAVTTTLQSVLKCQIQSYDRLDSGVTGTWTPDNWYCLNTTDNVTTSCDGYSESISEDITPELKYHLPIMDGTTPIGAGWTYKEEKSGNIVMREIWGDKDKCDPVYRTTTASESLPEQTWRCRVSDPGDTANGTVYTTGYVYCLDIANGDCGDYQNTIPKSDPCGGDVTSDAAKKKVKSIQYEYVTKDATGNTAKVGYSKKTTTMCNPAGNTDEYIYDTCVPDVAASGCNGSNDKNYKCYNQSKLYNANAIEREYNTCNPSADVSSVALSNKIDGKLNASALSVTSDGTLSYAGACNTNVTGVTTESINNTWYRKYNAYTTCANDITSGSKLYAWLNNFCSSANSSYSYSGTTSGADCYSTSPSGSSAPYKFELYVKISSGGDAILNSLNSKVDNGSLASAVSTEVATQIANANVITSDSIKEASISVTNGSTMTLEQVVQRLDSIGTCTTNPQTNKVTCSGYLGQAATVETPGS